VIISASYRSDIPAFHARWFEAALLAGKAEVPNPYSGTTTSIDLRPGAVDGYVFWTRNPRPFAPALDRVTAQAKPAIFQFTILGHPRKLDRRAFDCGCVAGPGACPAAGPARHRLAL
jgi:hypothetical protein